MSAPQTSRFLSEAREIRNRIYQYVVEEPFVFMDGMRTAEFLAVLMASTTFWFGAVSYNLIGVLNIIPATYRNRIQNVVVTVSAAQAFDATALAMLPMLRSVDFVVDGLDWVPDTKEDIAALVDHIADSRGLVSSSRDHINKAYGQTLLFLNPAGIPANIKAVVAVPIQARLPSKADILMIRGAGLPPSVNDQDVTFELRYVWSSGKVVGGRAELAKAREELLRRLEYDNYIETMRAAYMNGPPSSLELGDIEDIEWEIEEWDDREGAVFLAEGREWVLKGVVEEYEF